MSYVIYRMSRGRASPIELCFKCAVNLVKEGENFSPRIWAETVDYGDNEHDMRSFTCSSCDERIF